MTLTWAWLWLYAKLREKHACPVCGLYHRQRYQEHHGELR